MRAGASGGRGWGVLAPSALRSDLPSFAQILVCLHCHFSPSAPGSTPPHPTGPNISRLTEVEHAGHGEQSQGLEEKGSTDRERAERKGHQRQKHPAVGGGGCCGERGCGQKEEEEATVREKEIQAERGKQGCGQAPSTKVGKGESKGRKEQEEEEGGRGCSGSPLRAPPQLLWCWQVQEAPRSPDTARAAGKAGSVPAQDRAVRWQGGGTREAQKDAWPRGGNLEAGEGALGGNCPCSSCIVTSGELSETGSRPSLRRGMGPGEQCVQQVP